MSDINFKPLANRILVKPDEANSVTDAGIIIPDSAKEKPQVGEVVAVGPKSELTKGDRILYGKHAGTEIIFDDVSYMIMTDADVLGIK